MLNKEALHQLYTQCQKINFDESYDIIASAASSEEADFFRVVSRVFRKNSLFQHQI